MTPSGGMGRSEVECQRLAQPETRLNGREAEATKKGYDTSDTEFGTNESDEGAVE